MTLQWGLRKSRSKRGKRESAWDVRFRIIEAKVEKAGID
jgi:hypothetical protein